MQCRVYRMTTKKLSMDDILDISGEIFAMLE